MSFSGRLVMVSCPLGAVLISEPLSSVAAGFTVATSNFGAAAVWAVASPVAAISMAVTVLIWRALIYEDVTTNLFVRQHGGGNAMAVCRGPRFSDRYQM